MSHYITGLKDVSLKDVSLKDVVVLQIKSYVILTIGSGVLMGRKILQYYFQNNT